MNARMIGKTLGGAGVAILVGSLYTYLVTGQNGWIAGGQAVLGLLLIGVWLFTNWTTMGQFGSARGTSFFMTTVALAVALLAGLAALNYIVTKKDKTWDLTAKKIYSLAPQTTSTLKSLTEKVTAIAFIPDKDPNYGPLDNILHRYQAEAPDKFDYTFKDPMKNPDLTQKYNLKQGQATVVLTRGEGSKQTQTTLNIVSEQELTNALIKLNSANEQKIYFVIGHGEPTLDEVQAGADGQPAQSVSELKQSLAQEGYLSEPLNLSGITEIPKDAALVVIQGSKGKFAEPEVKLVEKYLDQGGRVAYFAEANVDPGLDPVLAKYGVQVDNGLVADNRFANGSPYVIVSPFFGDHEIGKVLKEMQMNTQLPMTRGLSVLHQGQAEGVETNVVLTSSPFAWEESTPNDNPQPDSGEKVGSIPLVVASTRKITAPDKRFDEARVVVFGDSEPLLNAMWGYEPNRNFILNAIAWATNQVQKVTIRPPDRDISTVDIDDKTMAKIRFLAMDLAPLSLLILGLAIWNWRRNK